MDALIHFHDHIGLYLGFTVGGFTKNAVDAKLRKMRKVISPEVMNCATNRMDIEERNAIQQACACLATVSLIAHSQPSTPALSS